MIFEHLFVNNLCDNQRYTKKKYEYKNQNNRERK